MTEDLIARLRQTRTNMLGTDDEQHYHDCHEAADALEAQALRVKELEEFQQGAFNEIFHWSSECEKHEVRIAELEAKNKKLIELYGEAFEENKSIKSGLLGLVIKSCLFWLVADSVYKVLGWFR